MLFSQVQFYGPTAWSIFSHISVPLGIYFRYVSLYRLLDGKIIKIMIYMCAYELKMITIIAAALIVRTIVKKTAKI